MTFNYPEDFYKKVEWFVKTPMSQEDARLIIRTLSSKRYANTLRGNANLYADVVFKFLRYNREKDEWYKNYGGGWVPSKGEEVKAHDAVFEALFSLTPLLCALSQCDFCHELQARLDFWAKDDGRDTILEKAARVWPLPRKEG